MRFLSLLIMILLPIEGAAAQQGSFQPADGSRRYANDLIDAAGKPIYPTTVQYTPNPQTRTVSPADAQRAREAEMNILRLMDRILQNEEKKWWVYSYDKGSVRDLQLLKFDDYYVFRSIFNYTNGEADVAMAQVSFNGDIECFYYASDRTCNGSIDLDRIERAAVTAVVVGGGIAALLTLMSGSSANAGGASEAARQREQTYGCQEPPCEP